MTQLKIDHDTIREKTIEGRYMRVEDIQRVFKAHGAIHLETLGYSVLGRPIEIIRLGQGRLKILMWSQMHGNESTTTKAVLDCIHYLNEPTPESKFILENCSICIIPILNPDGAAAYTRINANGIDLNRDAQNLREPESRILRKVLDDFKPDYCFNLHDQRTLFSVGKTSKPATLSFLAPAHDKNRSISRTRGVSMQLIVAMNQLIQRIIPGQVGRYDDAFNANCVGDTFQMLGIPTILFEAGHFPNDYQREKTRIYMFQAILQAIWTIANNAISDYDRDDYFLIPENGKQFFDILIKDAHLIGKKYDKGVSVGISYEEKLESDTISFIPKVKEIGALNDFYGHKEYNCTNRSDLRTILEMPLLMQLLQ
ncbi:MAG: M14 metallopeptidase family protein [Bacteroidota bacterium]